MSDAMTVGETVKIKGVSYVVVTAKPYVYQGSERTEFTMRRPKGQRSYYVVRYSNGSLSEVV